MSLNHWKTARWSQQLKRRVGFMDLSRTTLYDENYQHDAYAILTATGYALPIHGRLNLLPIQYRRYHDIYLEVVARYDEPKVCTWCSQPLSDQDITLDHLFPSYEGGPTQPDNLVIACWNCNFTRQHMMIEEWTHHAPLIHHSEWLDHFLDTWEDSWDRLTHQLWSDPFADATCIRDVFRRAWLSKHNKARKFRAYTPEWVTLEIQSIATDATLIGSQEEYFIAMRSPTAS